MVGADDEEDDEDDDEDDDKEDDEEDDDVDIFDIFDDGCGGGGGGGGRTDEVDEELSALDVGGGTGTGYTAGGSGDGRFARLLFDLTLRYAISVAFASSAAYITNPSGRLSRPHIGLRR